MEEEEKMEEMKRWKRRKIDLFCHRPRTLTRVSPEESNH